MPDYLALQAGLLPYYYLLASCFAPRCAGPALSTRHLWSNCSGRRALRQGGLNLLYIPASGSLYV
jgi:hypothetical protein